LRLERVHDIGNDQSTLLARVEFLPDRPQEASQLVVSADRSHPMKERWLDAHWHYASIDYDGHSLGLLVETDKASAARRDAEALCVAFGIEARVLLITRVVVQ
jgi:hypothetical protein